jgi:hypothetical protein
MKEEECNMIADIRDGRKQIDKCLKKLKTLKSFNRRFMTHIDELFEISQGEKVLNYIEGILITEDFTDLVEENLRHLSSAIYHTLKLEKSYLKLCKFGELV